MDSSSTFKRISSANRDIEKIPAPLRSHISSPKSPNLWPRWSPSSSPRSGVQTWLLRSSHTYPCKTLFPTIRLTLLGSDFPCLYQYEGTSDVSIVMMGREEWIRRLLTLSRWFKVRKPKEENGLASGRRNQMT
ncbi:hypothetical protein AVEN_158841-1 [Araneus ventricosus]|uniref:Uncharacterized protein n=1 Tax=Araneus ventricosus TaxID=182803 RepID=A0A4Y2MWS9_ARAVE|nr:hypothetical protein AVEN_158841-1 [Araneus ventricosus]